MSDTEFTKGGWYVHTVEPAVVIIPGGVLDIAGIPSAKANAHLIASAPDMYRSLKRQRTGLLNLIDLDLIPKSYVDSVRHEISLIDNELARARGE